MGVNFISHEKVMFINLEGDDGINLFIILFLFVCGSHLQLVYPTRRKLLQSGTKHCKTIGHPSKKRTPNLKAVESTLYVVVTHNHTGADRIWYNLQFLDSVSGIYP